MSTDTIQLRVHVDHETHRVMRTAAAFLGLKVGEFVARALQNEANDVLGDIPDQLGGEDDGEAQDVSN